MRAHVIYPGRRIIRVGTHYVTHLTGLLTPSPYIQGNHTLQGPGVPGLPASDYAALIGPAICRSLNGGISKGVSDIDRNTPFGRVRDIRNFPVVIEFSKSQNPGTVNFGVDRQMYPDRVSVVGDGLQGGGTCRGPGSGSAIALVPDAARALHYLHERFSSPATAWPHSRLHRG